MADYSTEKGFTIQSYASDPLISLAGGGSWASGGALNTGRYNAAGAGTSSATILAGGYSTPPGTRHTQTETYDGTSWTEVADLATGKNSLPGIGTTTAAIVVGGAALPGYTIVGTTEKWDGTSWTEVADLNTVRDQHGGSANGTITAGLVWGGYGPPNLALVESWNGTSWTEVADLNATLITGAATGTSTASFAAGGTYGGAADSVNVQLWNGTSWSATTSLTTGRSQMGAAGTTSAGLVFGGSGYVANTEDFNGSVWTEDADLAQAKALYNSGAGTTAVDAIAPGGQGPGVTTQNEVWTAPAIASIVQEGQVWYNTTSTVLKGFGLSVPGGAWSSGGTMSTGRTYAGGAGLTINTSMAFGGSSPGGNTVNTEKYDGTTWTEVNNLNTAVQGAMGAGTQTSAFSTSGKAPAQTTDSELWDGTSWSEEANVNSARHFGGGAGTSTAAVIYSGGVWNEPSKHKLTEEWNGTSWTETADLVDAHMTNVGSFGLSSTSAMCVSGYTYPPGTPDVTTFVEEWNGTSWTENTAIPTGAHYMRGNGTVSSGFVAGGQTPSNIANTQYWNGSAWSELSDLPTATAAGSTSQNSPSSEGLYAGGAGVDTTSSEWTTGNAIKTFTAT